MYYIQIYIYFLHWTEQLIILNMYRDAYLDSQERVKDLVYAYNLYGAKPNQVAGDDAPASGQNPSLDGYYN